MNSTYKRPKLASEALQLLIKGEEIELENQYVEKLIEALKKNKPELNLQAIPDKANSGWSVLRKEQPKKEVKENPIAEKTKPELAKRPQKEQVFPEDMPVPDQSGYEKFVIQRKIKSLVELYAKRNLLERNQKAQFIFLNEGIEKGPNTKKFNVEGVPVWIKITNKDLMTTIEYSTTLL